MRRDLVRIRCYCSVGCTAFRWASVVEAIELGLFDPIEEVAS